MPRDASERERIARIEQRGRWLGASIACLLLAGTACRAHLADPRAVDAALARYARFATSMAHDSVAALFADDGALVAEGTAPIVGPRAISAHLHSFVGFHVLTNTLVADTTQVSRDAAYQAGRFRQQVIVPGGDTVVAQGRFTVQWVRDHAHGWRIHRMATRPPQS